MEPVREQPALAGRVTERASLVALVRRAVEGRPGAVLVHGEAGVGKTSLVRSVADEVRADGVQVLWGSGLRFDAAEALLLPVTMALDRWLRDADPDTRERALAGVPGVSAVLPSLGRPADEVTETRRVVVVDALLNRILELGPALFVVDDVQWADQASLTALAYLIAGFSRQPLALVTTHRDEESHHADEFRTWFADMRRMPSVDVLPLERLDRETTRSQVAGLLGAEPADTLLDQVFRRSEGNAYLTELLVSETRPHAESLPEPLPTVLQDALLSAWQRLEPAARALTRTTGGRGTARSELPALRDVVLALNGEQLSTTAVHQAVDAGHRRPGRRDGLVPPPPARRRADGAVPPGRGCIDPCGLGPGTRHHVGLGDRRGPPPVLAGPAPRGRGRCARCLRGEPHGGGPGRRAGVAREAARHLVRAASLWDSGAPDPDDTSARVTLLERAAVMCNETDRGETGYALIGQALALVDEAADPLQMSRLLMERADLEWELGQQADPPLDTLRRAVELHRLGAGQRRPCRGAHHAEQRPAFRGTVRGGGSASGRGGGGRAAVGASPGARQGTRR